MNPNQGNLDTNTHHHHHHHHHHQNDDPNYNPALNTTTSPQGQYDNKNNMNTGYDNTNVNPGYNNTNMNPNINPGYNTNINPNPGYNNTNPNPGYTNTNTNPGYNTTTGTTAGGYNNPSTLTGAPAGVHTGGPTDTSLNQPYNNAPTTTLNQPYDGNNLSTNPATQTYDNQTGIPSASHGLKNTVTGTFQKIAGSLSGDNERKMAGEMKKLEGKQEVRAAQQHHGLNSTSNVGYGSTTGYQGGNYDNTLNNPNPPVAGQTYGVGQNTAQGYNPAIPNQNTTTGYGTGKYQQGYTQGNLGGVQTREE